MAILETSAQALSGAGHGITRSTEKFPATRGARRAARRAVIFRRFESCARPVIDDGHLTTFAVTETAAAFRLTETITPTHGRAAAIEQAGDHRATMAS